MTVFPRVVTRGIARTLILSWTALSLDGVNAVFFACRPPEAVLPGGNDHARANYEGGDDCDASGGDTAHSATLYKNGAAVYSKARVVEVKDDSADQPPVLVVIDNYSRSFEACSRWQCPRQTAAGASGGSCSSSSCSSSSSCT